MELAITLLVLVIDEWDLEIRIMMNMAVATIGLFRVTELTWLYLYIPFQIFDQFSVRVLPF